MADWKQFCVLKQVQAKSKGVSYYIKIFVGGELKLEDFYRCFLEPVPGFWPTGKGRDRTLSVCSSSSNLPLSLSPQCKCQISPDNYFKNGIRGT